MVTKVFGETFAAGVGLGVGVVRGGLETAAGVGRSFALGSFLSARGRQFGQRADNYRLRYRYRHRSFGRNCRRRVCRGHQQRHWGTHYANRE